MELSNAYLCKYAFSCENFLLEFQDDWLSKMFCLTMSFFKDILLSDFSEKHLLSQEIAKECQGMNWGTFKPLLTDALVDHLHPIQVLTFICIKEFYILRLIWSCRDNLQLIYFNYYILCWCSDLHITFKILTWI